MILEDDQIRTIDKKRIVKTYEYLSKKEILILNSVLKETYIFGFDECGTFQIKLGSVKIKLIFAWYDLWIGAFWDQKKRCLYIFPIPMFGVILKFGTDSNSVPEKQD